MTQVGGFAWILAALSKRLRILVFTMVYAAMYLTIPQAALSFDRVALPCFATEDVPLQAQSPLYCLLFRNYVTPEVAELATALAVAMNGEYPGTVTLYLDGGLPFGDMPLLPHLSHRDGRKLDLAYYYTDADGTYLPGKTRSPIGYWAFETPPTTAPLQCINNPKPNLRWDMDWLQSLFPNRPLDTDRTRAMVRWLIADGPSMGVNRMFLEPHLVESLGVASKILRFQGCRAARHDDHIHIEISD